MQTLPVEFDRKGWHFKQLKREGMLAIYLRTKPSMDGQSTIESYEVIEIRIEKEKVRFERIVPEHERYPGDEEWGKYGWPYRSFKDAITKLKALALCQPEPKTAVFIAGEGKDSTPPVKDARFAVAQTSQENGISRTKSA